MELARVKKGLARPSLVVEYAKYRYYNLYNSLFSSPPLSLPEDHQRNLDLNDREFRQKSSVLGSLPTRLTVLLGKRCNLRCRMCNYALSGVQDDPAYLKGVWGEYLALLPYLEVLYLNGGEPFIYRQTRDFVRRGLSNEHLRIKISTNLNSIDPEWLDYISSGRIDLSISLDAASAGTYSKIRVGGSFSRVLGNLKEVNRVRKAATHLKLNFIVMRANCHEIGAFADLAHEHGANVVNFQMLKNSRWDSSFFREQRIDGDREIALMVAALLAQARDRCRRLGLGYRSNLEHLAGGRIPVGRQGGLPEEGKARIGECRSLWDHVSVSWERSNICCWSHPKYCFASYRIRDIWNSRLVVEARRRFAAGRYDDFCTAACPVYSLHMLRQ